MREGHTENGQLLIEVRGGLGILTLNRPTALNALTLTMVRELHAALEEWKHDDAVKAVVFRGSGNKAFCAGGDIRAIYDNFKAGNKEYLTFFAEEYVLDHAIHRYPKPTYALMDGYVLGGGMGLSQGCRARIVTERSHLAMPEVGIGFFPDVGGSYFLSRLPGAIGLYLGLTGEPVGAADAVYCGLADACVPSEDLELAITALASWISRGGDPLDWKSALAALIIYAPGEVHLAQMRSGIDLHFPQSDVLSILSSLKEENRADHAKWVEKTLATMDGRSPLAMSVTLEQLRRAGDMTLEQCLQMELTMDEAWLPRGDMIEGVRALLVDKDKTPRWNPPTLGQVTQEMVNSFFVEGNDGRKLIL